MIFGLSSLLMKQLVRTIIIWGLLILLTPQLSLAQGSNGPTQQIRGEVLETGNQVPLSGVIVFCRGLEEERATLTDSLGQFSFSKIPVGRVNLEFRYLGYLPYMEDGVLIEAGRETIKRIELRPIPKELSAVIVEAKNYSTDPFLAFSTISAEEIQRFPANYFDPARYYTQTPGILSDHDGANGLIVRGTSPSFFRWRLEGLEIVNPNHTANAGTFGDRSAANAGGVNMLSTLAMDRATLYRNSGAMLHGNSLSGMMDMQYRKGNQEQFELNLAAGLLGLEAAAEGPLGKKGASYLIHYRYSFVGLLGGLGVDFGDEEISFQDLSFHLHLPTKSIGTFSLFGLGGNSSNYFLGKDDLADVETEKDLQEIDFQSEMGTLGLKHQVQIGKRMSWSTRAAISATESSRLSNPVLADIPVTIFESDSTFQQKISVITSLNSWKGEERFLSFGLGYLQQEDRLFASLSRYQNVESKFEVSSVLLRNSQMAYVYGNWRRAIGLKWNFALGFYINYYVEGEQWKPELRFSMQYEAWENHYFKVMYDAFSQISPPEASGRYFTSEPGSGPALPLMSAENLSLKYFWDVKESVQFTAEIYHNIYYNLPVSSFPDQSYSAFNQVDLSRLASSNIKTDGEGRTFGLEVGYRKLMKDDWFYLASGTLYRSFYTGSQGVELPSAFDRKFNLSGTLGKEWTKVKEDKSRVFGASTRVLFAGGLQAAPIDLDVSMLNDLTLFDYSNGYTESYPAYFRVDLQLNVTWNRPGFSQRLSLDIQNATNQQNLANYYYDSFTGEIMERYQLGMIPLLTYRVSF